MLEPKSECFQCCDDAVRKFRLCRACEGIWVQCDSCDAQFMDLEAALYRPPAAASGQAPRVPTCPFCAHSIPPRFAAEQVVVDRRVLPYPGRELVADERSEAGPNEATAKKRSSTCIMYVDLQNGENPRIMRVSVSKTARTVFVEGRAYGRTGSGYKFNFIGRDERRAAWISRPRRDGFDALYPQVVQVDADVREAYWCEIRNRPQDAACASYKSPGKYTKRGRGSRQSGAVKK